MIQEDFDRLVAELREKLVDKPAPFVPATREAVKEISCYLRQNDVFNDSRRQQSCLRVLDDHIRLLDAVKAMHESASLVDNQMDFWRNVLAVKRAAGITE